MLHCISSYPNKEENSYLSNINYLKKKFSCEVGLSDHTNGIKIPIYANVLGAKIIEKHITLKKNDTGPDHFCSLESKDCKNFVDTNRLKVEMGKVEKMSKSKKNVVDPNDIISSYGADTARWFMLSDSPPERDLQWTDTGIAASFKFINKLYEFIEKFKNYQSDDVCDDRTVESLKDTINKVSENIELLAESAIRAVRLCQPLKVPPTGYEKWKNLQLNFDAGEMLEG